MSADTVHCSDFMSADTVAISIVSHSARLSEIDAVSVNPHCVEAWYVVSPEAILGLVQCNAVVDDKERAVDQSTLLVGLLRLQAEHSRCQRRQLDRAARADA